MPYLFLCSNNWDKINAISNIGMAVIAFISLGVSFYLLLRDKKQKKEDNRARINCSIVKEEYGYYLLVENVGKEVAYDISLTVSGKPISDNLYKFVKIVFSDLSREKFIIKPNDKKYFYIAPPIRQEWDLLRLPWKEHFSNENINNWLKEYDKEYILVSGNYNNKYKIDYKFSIRDFNVIGTFQIPEPIDNISKTLIEIKRNLRESEKELHVIAGKLKK